MSKINVGVIGCGNISDVYFKAARIFTNLEFVAVSDLDIDRAISKASEFDIPKVCSVADIFAQDNIQVILNLTVPGAHFEVSVSALRAGKHVFCEKPLATTFEDGESLLRIAASSGRRIGCAPDTFLGGGLQTCRKLIDDGWIGKPIAVNASMVCHGHEHWHPDPSFYYKVGGGPMFDMGPYYLTALVSILGPITNLNGKCQTTFAERTILSSPKSGQKITVEVPTHVTALLEFECGAIGILLTSFDVWGSDAPKLEIHGTLGSLSLPDPNTFGGPIKFRAAGQKVWSEIPIVFGFTDNSRGIGLSEMASSIEQDRTHRCSATMALHVLETMEGIHISSQIGTKYTLTTHTARPEILPLGLVGNNVDLS